MPPIRARRKKEIPPDGYMDIEDTLLEFQNKKKDFLNESDEGKRKDEAKWGALQIEHQCTRWIYDLYEKEAISKELYNWLIKKKHANNLLIAKWKKMGYEKLCCLKCIETKDKNFETTCICRVPRKQHDEKSKIECVTCGCHGCASSD